MNNLHRNSKYKLGVRHFEKKNILIQGGNAIGTFFIAVENYQIVMYQLLSINFRDTFSHKLKKIKVFDKKYEIWKPVPEQEIEVNPNWFAKRATFIQSN